MTATSSELTDSAIRNQVLLERLKTSEAGEFLPYLRRIERTIRKALSDAGETIETKAKLSRLLTDLSTAQKAIYDEYNAQLSLNLQDIGVQQATFEGESYNNAVANFESKIPDSAQIATALRVNPLQVADYNGNLLLEPFTRDFSNRELKRISNTITQGFYQGQTNAQITRAIRGTRANNFNDGELAKTQRANNAMVRTAVQHVSSQARQVTEKENSDLVKGYKWVSTLDSRTTSQCQSLDGREFKTGEGPLPPIHVNSCVKGTLVATSKGQVPIEDVKVGDRVLTHTSSLKKVSCVMAKKNDTQVVKLINNFGEWVRLTDDHPVLTSNGWKKVRDIKVGDKVFNNGYKLVRLKDWIRKSFVKKQVLIDAHNKKTEATKELVSYSITSFSAGVSSAINLNNDVIKNNKVGNIFAYCLLKIKRNIKTGE